MTMSIEPNRRYTVDEYLELEGRSPERKYEFRDGLIVDMREALAMAGGSENHCLINANLIAALSNRLNGGRCRVYSNDLRIRIPRKTLYTFPDAAVVCGKTESEQHKTAGVTITNPTTIVEVLSPSTELYDRGEKFSLYREIPSLREYVLISQSAPRVETFYRRDDGGWSFGPYEGRDAVAKLLSLGIDLPLSEVFRNVEFPLETSEPAA
jgi:Uma2 family endonuclease